MTSLSDNTIDGLIRRIKTVRSVSDFVFAAEYPPREMPHPIGKYVVTVINAGMRIKRRFVGDRVAGNAQGTLYQITLRLRVYAPAQTSGAALLRATCLLADAVELSDSERSVQDLSFSGIAYDPAAHTVYRDLTVTLFCMAAGEVQDD